MLTGGAGLEAMLSLERDYKFTSLIMWGPRMGPMASLIVGWGSKSEQTTDFPGQMGVTDLALPMGAAVGCDLLGHHCK